MSEEITVTVDEGEPQRVPRGTSAREALGPKLGRKALAVRTGDRLVDVSEPIDSDCTLLAIDAESDDGLEIIRHSSAHLMAHAVKRLFPKAQVTIGPVIQDGFYYDFCYQDGFTADDLERIEAEMKKIVTENIAVVREQLPRDQAMALFESMGEEFKAEIIRDLTDESVSLYRQGDFVDLCRGPHVPSTGRLGSFKLLSVAGAYWRGDETRPMLQRIYATAFADRKELKRHLAMLEEAKKRDHRVLGKQLGLFSFHREAPGSPFFHADGTVVYNLLIDYIRGLYRRYDYSEVITPQMLDVDLWHRSGHYDNYRENMYFTEIEDREFAVKPMNCPTHCLMYSEDLHSYRDLPIRIADFGRLHRFERSGVVHGLTRVRSFAQDDAHIFCTPDQIGDEIRSVIRMVREAHATFGFDKAKVYLSTKPNKALGDAAMWERAEAALHQVLTAEGVDYEVKAGDGAFYGPKIDFCILDAMRREWQLSTVQLDFFLPGALRAQLRRRRQYQSASRDDPPCRARVARALHGHPDRTYGRGATAVAGPDSGPRRDGNRSSERLRDRDPRPTLRAWDPRSCRPTQRETRFQDS